MQLLANKHFLILKLKYTLETQEIQPGKSGKVGENDSSNSPVTLLTVPFSEYYLNDILFKGLLQ